MYLAVLKSNSDHKYFYLFIYLLIFDYTESSLLHIGFLQCNKWVLFFVPVHWLLIAVSSLVGEHGFICHMACGLWDLPWPGNKPLFPALEGWFLNPGLPGKSDCQPQNRESKGFKNISVITCKFYFKKLALFFIMNNCTNIYNI